MAKDNMKQVQQIFMSLTERANRVKATPEFQERFAQRRQHWLVRKAEADAAMNNAPEGGDAAAEMPNVDGETTHSGG